jgi:hypothetical protein
MECSIFSIVRINSLHRRMIYLLNLHPVSTSTSVPMKAHGRCLLHHSSNNKCPSRSQGNLSQSNLRSCSLKLPHQWEIRSIMGILRLHRKRPQDTSHPHQTSSSSSNNNSSIPSPWFLLCSNNHHHDNNTPHCLKLSSPSPRLRLKESNRCRLLQLRSSPKSNSATSIHTLYLQRTISGHPAPLHPVLNIHNTQIPTTHRTKCPNPTTHHQPPTPCTTLRQHNPPALTIPSSKPPPSLNLLPNNDNNINKQATSTPHSHPAGPPCSEEAC